MLASLQYAKSNSDIFTNSIANDIVLRGYSSNQHILVGFGSNIESAINISKSNFSIDRGTVYASNVSVGLNTTNSNFNLYVAGSTRIEGDLLVNGVTTTLNTDLKVTERFSVSNNGTGPALEVTQYGAQPIAAFKDDNITVLHIADGGFVCIGSNTSPTTKLDVEGTATIRGNILTSNISGSNITLLANMTTCNVITSNLIINNQVIIASNGVITNSNFLPPFNTSNVVSGQFTSNFILDDNIISSKLASNLILKGTTTISSNATICNGDLLIKGSNNFVNLGDQARLYLGSNSYLVGASRDVGLVMQVPGTTYPFILENNSGFVGLGVMDPQENLHVYGNTKVEGSQYVMSNLGVGTSNPTFKFHVLGDIYSSSNIRSAVGTLGPTFILIPESAYADISVGSSMILDNTLEAGNPANSTLRSLFYGNSFLYQDTSGENMSWKFARLLFRGCPLTQLASTSVMTVQDYVSSRSPQYSNMTSSFTLSNDGSDYGYVSYATPWFSMASSNSRHLALNLSSNSQNAVFRVGQVHIQFKC
jgi:hypothetical protein